MTNVSTLISEIPARNCRDIGNSKSIATMSGAPHRREMEIAPMVALPPPDWALFKNTIEVWNVNDGVPIECFGNKSISWSLRPHYQLVKKIREWFLFLAAGITDIPDLYEVEPEAELLDFFAKDPDVLPVLREARPQLANFFGQAVRIRLSVEVDPEIVGFTQLVVAICCPLGAPEAVEKLTHFVEQWWLPNPRSRRTDICFIIEPG